ncbi:glycosyltransferase 1 domain-containing protein 1-like [Clavelina lepadiformis]|uniref:glycosyltransferase 1 domain-containing protein 1-like n=1 Tax=Clavelina lepadiformis TaxID=159417 RepID=UPI004040EF7F
MLYVMETVLLLSPTLAATGNTSTVSRLQNHFERKSFCVLVTSPHDLFSQKVNYNCKLKRINKHIVENKVNFVILIHAFKSGSCVICTCSNSCKLCVKYAVVFGGTDLNEDIKYQDKFEVMKTCLNNAVFCVAFTESLLAVARIHYPNTPAYLQQQALSYQLYNVSINDSCKSHVSTKTPLVFLLSCSIREVKDPLFLLEDFLTWRKLATFSRDIRLLILGPVTGSEYANLFFKQMQTLIMAHHAQCTHNQDDKLHINLKSVISFPPLPGSTGIEAMNAWLSIPDGSVIQYLKPFEQSEFQELLRTDTFFAMINCSKSEGMSASLLEAMACGLPVLARNISGNNAVITDYQNGLLFSQPQEFVNKAMELIIDDDLLKKLVCNAKQYVFQSHNPYKEGDFYCSLLTKYTSKVDNDFIS